VHPAEVAGSFVVEGILKYLTGKSREANHLRELYVFKVIPMLNPEGVICGNFRCSLTGADLNRRWDTPDAYLHPQIYYLKTLLRKMSNMKKSILAFCDLHGHSKRTGVFIYGCKKEANSGFCSWTKVRLLPRIIARRSPLFNYAQCRFAMENTKQRTARIVVWKEFGITNSFTLESSCYGYLKDGIIIPFGDKDYYEIGQVLLNSLLEYHYVVKGLEHEMLITKGWLKPNRLLQLTGIPAGDILAKELKQAKKEQIRNYRLKSAGDKRTRIVIGNVNTRIVEQVTQQLNIDREHFVSKKMQENLKCKRPQTQAGVKKQLEFKEEKNEWRDYFSKEEIENVYNDISQDVEPAGEPLSSESDASEINIESEYFPKYLVEPYNDEEEVYPSVGVRKKILMIGNFRRLLKNKKKQSARSIERQVAAASFLIKGKNMLPVKTTLGNYKIVYSQAKTIKSTAKVDIKKNSDWNTSDNKINYMERKKKSRNTKEYYDRIINKYFSFRSTNSENTRSANKQSTRVYNEYSRNGFHQMKIPQQSKARGLKDYFGNTLEVKKNKIPH